eukprot:TRINITY_DN9929_c0_g1_i1.p1 TRINITY_DN9929_c0_g1~~TRINITY_DN9929_c0_g1_i1.p1  ORF type:complete len:420 (-),score=66.06 TRINITY_DN9929_c0_g1_i1:712-1971(-)
MSKVQKRKSKATSKVAPIALGKVQVPKLRPQVESPTAAADDGRVLTRLQQKQQLSPEQQVDDVGKESLVGNSGDDVGTESLAGNSVGLNKSENTKTGAVTRSIPKPVPDFMDRFPKDLAVDYDLIASVDRMNRDLAKLYDEKLGTIFNPVFDDQTEQEENNETQSISLNPKSANDGDIDLTGMEQHSKSYSDLGLNSDSTSQPLKITVNYKTTNNFTTTNFPRTTKQDIEGVQKVGQKKQARKRKLDQQSGWNNSEQVPVYLDSKKSRKEDVVVVQEQILLTEQAPKKPQPKPKAQKGNVKRTSKKDDGPKDTKQVQQFQKRVQELQEELTHKSKENQEIQQTKNKEILELKEVVNQQNKEITGLKSREWQLKREVQVLKDENKLVKSQKGRQSSLRKAQQLADLSTELVNELIHLKYL